LGSRFSFAGIIIFGLFFGVLEEGNQNFFR